MRNNLKKKKKRNNNMYPCVARNRNTRINNLFRPRCSFPVLLRTSVTRLARRSAHRRRRVEITSGITLKHAWIVVKLVETVDSWFRSTVFLSTRGICLNEDRAPMEIRMYMTWNGSQPRGGSNKFFARQLTDSLSFAKTGTRKEKEIEYRNYSSSYSFLGRYLSNIFLKV